MSALGEHGNAKGGSGIWRWKMGTTTEFVKRTRNPHKARKKMEIVYAKPMDVEDAEVIDDELEVSIPQLGIRVGHPDVFSASSAYYALTVTRLLDCKQRNAYGNAMKIRGQTLQLHAYITGVQGQIFNHPEKLLDAIQRAVSGEHWPLLLEVSNPFYDLHQEKMGGSPRIKRGPPLSLEDVRVLAMRTQEQAQQQQPYSNRVVPEDLYEERDPASGERAKGAESKPVDDGNA